MCALFDFSPGNTPHNPVRFADTVGIVIERVRPESSIGMWSEPPSVRLSGRGVTTRHPIVFDPPKKDRLRWYCRAPGQHETPTVIREESFHVTDLGTQLKPPIERWMTDEESRRCPACGTIAEAK
jgi:3-hydroxyanthranilate 3,4-dioxygenase